MPQSDLHLTVPDSILKDQWCGKRIAPVLSNQQILYVRCVLRVSPSLPIGIEIDFSTNAKHLIKRYQKRSFPDLRPVMLLCVSTSVL